MVSLRTLSSLLATAMVLPMTLAQTSSDCTCPSVGSLFTTTIFYDPNSMSGMMSGMTSVAATGTGAGGTGVSSATLATNTASSSNVASVVAAIRAVTAQSQALQSPASSLTTTNGPLIAIGQGPLPGIIAGFANIVSAATAAVPAFQGLGNVPAGADADLIFDVFRDFVGVHQALLSILIGKAGLFTAVPIVGQPVAAALRSVENIVDTIAFALINAVQSQADNLQAEASSLDSSLSTAVSSYSGANTSNVAKL